MGFCSDEEHAEFMRSCPEFERMLVRSGIQMTKYWFWSVMGSRNVDFRSAYFTQRSAGS
jgi:polyphosphate kinase 2 (PPK2 family)